MRSGLVGSPKFLTIQRIGHTVLWTGFCEGMSFASTFRVNRAKWVKKAHVSFLLSPQSNKHRAKTMRKDAAIIGDGICSKPKDIILL